MDGIEDKLSAIFNSPESMEQIRRLAESLSGGGGEIQTDNSTFSKTSGNTGMESALVQSLLRVLQATNTPNDTTKLVSALKPWLDQERTERLERAVKIARLTTAAKNILPNLPLNRK